MARVTDAEVKEIIEVNTTLIPTTDPFINTANILVNETLLDQGYSENLLTQIELYLSAHFTGMKQRQLDREELGDAENEYMGASGLGLDFTQYGQQAKLLDINSVLENLGKTAPQMQVVSIYNC